ncbi:MAG: DUF4845 domain-containing protein [Ectothiorhodospiraceae bacterium]
MDMRTQSTGTASARCSTTSLGRLGRFRRTRHPGAHQRGVTLVGWLLILALLGIAVLLVLRVGPVYMEQWTVSSIVDDVAGDPELADAGVREVQRGVRRRMQVNTVSDAAREAVVVERSGENIVIVVEYEQRFPLVANLDGVASFRNEATVGQ